MVAVTRMCRAFFVAKNAAAIAIDAKSRPNPILRSELRGSSRLSGSRNLGRGLLCPARNMVMCDFISPHVATPNSPCGDERRRFLSPK